MAKVKDPSITYLNSLGYNVVKLPRAGIEPMDVDVAQSVPLSSNAYDHTPFSVADLSSALDRSMSKTAVALPFRHNETLRAGSVSHTDAFHPYVRATPFALS